MSFSKIKGLLGSFDAEINESEVDIIALISSAENAVRQLEVNLGKDGEFIKELKDISTLIESLKNIGEDKLQALFNNIKEEDGTLSDLGEPPIAPIATIDARGGSTKLSGYAGLVPQRKARKHKKHRKHEDSKCPCTAKLEKIRDDESLDDDTRETAEIHIKKLNKKDMSPRLAHIAKADAEDFISDVEDKRQKNEDIDTALDNLQQVTDKLDKTIKGKKITKNECKTNDQGHLEVDFEDEDKDKYKSSLIKRKHDLVAKLEKTPIEDREELDHELANINSELTRLAGMHFRPKAEAFKQDDEVKIVKGKYRGMKGIAKSADINLKDLEKEFQGEPVQQADVKSDTDVPNQYYVIDDKNKVRKDKDSSNKKRGFIK